MVLANTYTVVYGASFDKKPKYSLFYAIAHFDDVDSVAAAYKAAPHKINEPDERGTTPLLMACYLGKLQIIQFLVKNGAPVDQVLGKSELTPLICACKDDLPLVVKCLLDLKADVNKKGPLGYTPLGITLGWGHKQCDTIVSMLKDAKSDLKIIEDSTLSDINKNETVALQELRKCFEDVKNKKDQDDQKSLQ